MTDTANNSGLRKLAALTAGMTLLLILAGGFVTTTATGDTIPDWPKSWGRIEGGAWVEWTHRAFAGIVGILVLLLAIGVQRSESRPWVRKLAWFAFVAVVAQAILGGLRVWNVFPRAGAAIVHASFAQIVFGSVIAIAIFLSRSWRDAQENADAASARRLALTTTLLAFLQLVAGAVTRHTGSGLAIHLVNAGVILIVASLLISKLLTTPLRKGAMHLAGVLVAQIVLGFVALVITRSAGYAASTQTPVLQIVLVTLHVAMGAGFLAGSLALTLRCYRAAAPSPSLELVRT